MTTRAWSTIAAIWLTLAPEAARARTESEPRAAPGPTTIAETERARTADPSAPADAIVLLEEVHRIETSNARAKVWYHVRIKVLTEAGLERASQVEVRDLGPDSKLQKWWGHLILPNGEAFSLPADKLEDGIDPDTGERSIRGKFSRGEPGCVVDWGYVVTGALFPAFDVVPLQRSVPVDRLAVRWKRTGSLEDKSAIGGYQVANGVRGIEIIQDKAGVLLRARDLPAVAEGTRPALLVAWARRPVRVSSGSMVELSKVEAKFWDDRARAIEEEASDFAGSRERLGEAITAIPVPPDSDPAARLRAAYDWIGANVKARPNKWSPMPAAAVMHTRGRADRVLADGEGSEIERTLTFLAVARAWGADASLVLATDPAVWEWDRGMLLVEQFSHALVEVRPASGPPLLLAVGSGLPYGEVPRELSGARAMRATSRGAQVVDIP